MSPMGKCIIMNLLTINDPQIKITRLSCILQNFAVKEMSFPERIILTVRKCIFHKR